VKKFLKWLFIILLTMLGTVLVAWYLLRAKIQDIALHRLKVEVEATFGNYYHLQFDSIETAVIDQTLNIRIVNPVFTSDTTNSIGNDRFPTLFFKANEFVVGGIQIAQLLLSSKLEVGSIILKQPKLVVLNHLGHKPTQQAPDSVAPTKTNRKLISQISLHRLVLENGSIAAMNLNRPNDTLYHALDLTLAVDGLKIPLSKTIQPLKAATLTSLHFTMDDVAFNPTKGDYHFNINHLDFHLPQNELNCKQVKVIPKSSLIQISRKMRFQKTVATFKLGNVSLFNLNFDELANGRIHLQKLIIANSIFDLLRNKEKELNIKAVKPTFQQSLHKLTIPLHIDTVQLKNVSLRFQLKMANKNKPALVSLTKIQAQILGLNNAKQNKKPIRLNANAVLMKTGKLHFSASIPPHLQWHTFNGVVTTMPMSEWNPLLEAMAPVRIENGKINKLTFSGKAYAQTATGNFAIDYQDLDLTIYKKSKDGSLKPAKLLSFTAKKLIRQSHSVHTNESINRVQFSIRKEPYQGQIMLWIGSIIEGMESTLLPNTLKKQVDVLENKQLEKRRKAKAVRPAKPN
jgi:hypothetical protein